jgi:hypothetical protein
MGGLCNGGVGVGMGGLAGKDGGSGGGSIAGLVRTFVFLVGLLRGWRWVDGSSHIWEELVESGIFPSTSRS